ncbi:MAG: hypothetical protein LUD38_07585, partial [Parabacteroides sp.]|nr:hypothetical protein [Parabacteroides sp.]
TAITVISYTGAVVTGGTLSINTQGTSTVKSTVNTFAGFKGSAAAYGVQLGGDETNVTVGNSGGGSIASKVTSENDTNGNVVVGSNQSATAYGVYAFGEGVATGESPKLTVTIQAANGTGDISATVGGTNVQANNINASAYGVYASGVNLNVASGSTVTAAGISANVGAGTGTENTVGVTQTAAGLFANNSVVTIAGGKSTGTAFSATATNLIGKAGGQISAYGALVNNSTLNLSGYVSFGANLASSGTTDDEGNLLEGYALNGINSTNGIFNVAGGETSTDVTEVTFKNNSVFTVGEINLTVADGETTAAVGAATFQGDTGMNLVANGTIINIKAGATATGNTGLGGNATFKIQGAGNFDLTGGKINITASTMESNTSDTAPTASLVIGGSTQGDFTVNGTEITITGGTAATTGSKEGGTASIAVFGESTLTSANVTLDGGVSAAGTGAGGTASITFGQNTAITGGTYKLTGGVGGATGAGGAATITLGTTTTISGGTYTLTGGNGGAQAGGVASIVSANGTTGLTIKDDAVITLTGGDKTGEGAGGQALIDLTANTNSNATLSLGIDGETDGSSISIGNNAALKVNGGNTYEGTTITVSAGGELATGALGFKVSDGSTLILNQAVGAQSKMSGTSTIAGTLYINGTTEEGESVAGPYIGGLGNMTVTGEVASQTGDLYLQLNAGTSAADADQLTFGSGAEGGSMDAAYVGVGTNSGQSALNTNAKLTINEGNLTIDNLEVGATPGQNAGKGEVSLNGGYLTLGAPELNEDGKTYTSALEINTGSTFTIDNNGWLITDAYNIWQEDPSKVAEEVNANYGLGTLTYTLGYIELTNAKVDLGWLDAAKNAIKNASGNTTLVIDGALYQEDENGNEVPVTVYPNAPANDGKFPTKNYAIVGDDVAGLLPGTVLNATT